MRNSILSWCKCYLFDLIAVTCTVFELSTLKERRSNTLFSLTPILIELHTVKELRSFLLQSGRGSGVEPPREFCHRFLTLGTPLISLQEQSRIFQNCYLFPSVDSNSNILPQINPEAQTADIPKLNLTASFLAAYFFFFSSKGNVLSILICYPFY